MALKESLSGISTELDKILKQLKEIESTQTNINKSAGSYASALAGVGGRVSGSSIGGSGFSTPPAGPGSYSGGITPTASGGGTGPAGDPAKGSPGWARAAAATGAVLATAGYSFLPSNEDAIAYQSAFFRSSFMGANGYNQNDLEKMRAMFGNRQTDPFGMVTVANQATMSGMGMGTAHFGTVMQQSATTSLLFGQSNATAGAAQTSLYSGPTAGRLGNVGIFVSSLDTGNPRAFGDIVDQIWQRAYGNKNAKIPYESVAADLRGGYLGAWLRRNFGDNPGLYDQLFQAILMKAKAQGKSLDYSDLTGQGKNSAMGFAQSQGLNESNDPGYFMARGYGTQAKAIEGGMDELLGAWTSAMDKLIVATEAYANAMKDGNWFLEAVTWSKGFVQSIMSSPVLSVLGTAAGGLIAGLATQAAGAIFNTGAKTATDAAGTAVDTAAGAATDAATGGGSSEMSTQIYDELVRQTDLLRTISRCACAPSRGGSGTGDFSGGDFGGGDFGGPPISPFAAGSNGRVNGTGTTTSDSISARLSRGEYVINARAAQIIGDKNLNAMNSLGHDLGSGFASPAKAFATGGTTLDGWPALSSDDPQLQSFTVPGVKGSYLLRKDYAPMLLKVIQAYNQNVRKIDEGYGYRSGGAYYGQGLTNHMAGVAFDVDYDSYWGYPGSAIDPTPAQLTAIRNILSANPGIEWGGDWDKPKWYDPMHFEITDPSVKPSGGGSIPAADKPGRTDNSGSGGKSAPSMKMDSLLGTIAGAASVLKPNSFSLGGFSGGAQGLRLGLGSRFSWVGATLFGTTSSGGVSSPGAKQTTPAASKSQGSGNVAPTNNVGSGSGPEWLYKFLVSKGLRGDSLRVAWAIAMRESGGNPDLVAAGSAGSWKYPNVPGWINWTSSDSPHYDTGLFQINNVHLSKVQSAFGNNAGMNELVDVNKNYQIAAQISSNWSNLLAWGMNPDGSFNWSSYPDSWVAQYGAATEARTAEFFQQFQKYNTEGYSEGAYRTHTGMAQLHEGEMVLPANVAERFREVMREAGGARRGTGGDINITLKIEKASDAEAERFAKKVKQLLEQDSWETAMRTR